MNSLFEFIKSIAWFNSTAFIAELNIEMKYELPHINMSKFIFHFNRCDSKGVK